MDTISTPALDKFLDRHKPLCSYWIFSGDRHCSCGLDAALQEKNMLVAMAEGREEPEQTCALGELEVMP